MNDKGKTPSTYQVYLIRYSYDPVQYSPNDNPDIELPLTAGDYVFIYGDMDEDGFFDGELMDGRRGLVPSNFVEKVSAEDLEEFHLRPPSMRNGTRSSNGHASLLDINKKTQKDGVSIGSSASAAATATKERSGNDGSALLQRQTADSSSSSSLAAVPNGNREPTTPIAITEIIDPIDVPPPTDLRLERQLSTSFIIAWQAPVELPPEQIVSYNVYSNELFLTTVKGNDRCKALLEKLDPFKKHQISVRTVTGRGQSRDHLCSITIGSGDSILTPSGLRITDISTKTATISWYPAFSDLQHVITVNRHCRTVIRQGCCRCMVSGLTPDSEHAVTVCALDPDKLVPTSPSASITFLTLPEDLPDAPVDVQVEVGPQRGTLLVTWLPALRHKQAAAAAAVPSTDVVNRAAITGYAVYVDGTKVKQLSSPSGDHILLDSRCFASFPADPKLVTVRTAAVGDRESRDSRPAQLSHQMLEEIRTGMLLTEVELNTGTGGTGSRNASDSTGSSPVGDYTPSVDSSTGGGRDGFVGRSRNGNKLHYGMRLHPRAVPHIEITRDAMSGGSSGADDSDGSSTRHRTSTSGATARRRAKQSDSTTVRQDDSTRLLDEAPDRLPGSVSSRHRSRQDSADWSGAGGGRRRDVVRGEDPVGTDFLNSDPEAVDDSLIGCDSDLEIGHRGSAHPRNHVHGHAHRTRGAPTYRVFIALFDYEPLSMSPNPGAVDEELPFCEGQLIKIHGDKDADGFYLGEVEGRYGLVPCNMVSEVHVDSPDIAERLLRENSPTPPPGYSSSARGAGGRTSAGGGSGGTPPRTGRQRQHRLETHDQPRRHAVDPSLPVARGRPPPARKMIAIYDYNPHELSPNVDIEKELPFKMGDVITVYGDVDYDGFYRGKLGARRGLVPSNFLRPSPHHQPPLPPLHSSPDVSDLAVSRQMVPMRPGSNPLGVNARDPSSLSGLGSGVVDGQSRMPSRPPPIQQSTSRSRDPVAQHQQQQQQSENGVGDAGSRRYGSPNSSVSVDMDTTVKHRRLRDPP